MNGIFGNLFDFNQDGTLDTAEQALEFSVLDDMMHENELEDDADNYDADD